MKIKRVSVTAPFKRQGKNNVGETLVNEIVEGTVAKAVGNTLLEVFYSY